MDKNERFVPVTDLPEMDGVKGPRNFPHFEITPEHVALSPDEAWVLQRYIKEVDEESSYCSLYTFLHGYFVAGAYETVPQILVPTEYRQLLIGVYMGIFWELKNNDPEKALVVRTKIEAMLESEPEEVQRFFNKQFLGPLPDNSQN